MKDGTPLSSLFLVHGQLSDNLQSHSSPVFCRSCRFLVSSATSFHFDYPTKAPKTPHIMDPNKNPGPPGARNLSSYGPESNCTLTPGPKYCLVDYSVYEYRPSLAANVVFLVLYLIAFIIHAFLGFTYRTWSFVGVMLCGLAVEVIGYGGRLILYQNPFSFEGFLMQIICITFGPTFFTAGIYFTLSKM